MSRGSDGFEIADLCSSDSSSGRDLARGSFSSWGKWTKLQDSHREEERTDNLDSSQVSRRLLVD